jgi:hypothetical protein
MPPKLRADLSLAVDLIALCCAGAAVRKWLVHGNHWLTTVLILSACGWVTLIIGMTYLVTGVARLRPWSEEEDPHDDAVLLMSVGVVLCVLVPAGALVLVATVASLVLDSDLPWRIVGLTVASTLAIITLSRLVKRYRLRSVGA